MPKVEREIQQNPNGSTTITKRLVEDIPLPYGGISSVTLGAESHVHWPKSRGLIPNVPSRKKRMELIKRANMS